MCSQNTTSCASHEKCMCHISMSCMWCLDCLDCGLPSHGFCGLKMNNTNNSRYISFFFCYLCNFMQIVLIRFFIFHMINNSLLTINNIFFSIDFKVENFGHCDACIFGIRYSRIISEKDYVCMFQKRKLLRESWDYIKILKDREAKVKMAEETKKQ